MGQDEAPEVTFNCCFLRDHRNDLPVFVCCDRASRSIIAHAVPHKRADVSWRAEQVCRDVKRLGHYGRASLRSDHEPAVVRFLQEVATRKGVWALFWNTFQLTNHRQTVGLNEL